MGPERGGRTHRAARMAPLGRVDRGFRAPRNHGDMAMDVLEQIAAIAGLVVVVLVFAAMAITGALADGAVLRTPRRHRHRH